MHKPKTTRLVGRFLKDRSGNFAMIFGLATIPVVMSVGLAVNYSQTLHLKSSMQTALDAALTSTAREISVGKRTPADARVLLERFLNTNGRAVYSVQGKYILKDVIVDETARTVSATAYANTKLAFDVFGLKDPEVGVAGAAQYTDKQVEVAMMLDVTGSMQKTWKTDKIGDLQKAATSAVKTMLDSQDASNPRVRVALVPYAASVNAGGLSDILYVEENGKDYIPPRAGDSMFAPRKELPPFADYIKAVGDAAPRRLKDGCATERKLVGGYADISSDAPTAVRLKDNKEYYALINRAKDIVGKCPAANLVPLTADRDALIESIENFAADGYTGGAIGIQWTQYMLSNKWGQIIKDRGLGDGPAPVNPKKVAKVAILMTDGQFNTSYADAKSSTVLDRESSSRSNAEAICANMRNTDKIEIYTIGFDLNNPGMSQRERDQAKAVLKNCASADTGSIKHYYEVSTGEELERAFHEIIANTERVALTN